MQRHLQKLINLQKLETFLFITVTVDRYQDNIELEKKFLRILPVNGFKIA